MNYTFFINYNSVVAQVYPLNWLECSLVDEKEKDQVFYRRKFEGSLTFGGKKLCADFNLFYDIEVADPCGRIDLLILSDLDVYYEAYFSTAQGEWDLDAQTFTVQPLPTDNYSDWNDHGDDEYNILDDAVTGLSRFSTILDVPFSVTYEENFMLVDVIEYLAQQTFDAGISWFGGTIVSSFFTDVINPITLAANRYNLLTIAQKSDIRQPTASNPATIGMLSWNALAEILRSMNVYWRYNGTILTIEHISFFASAPGIDLRIVESTRSTNKYKYLKDSMPKYERFSWMEAYHADFVGLPIWYDSLCVNQDAKSNTTNFAVPVTTDVEYIYDSMLNSETQGNISNDGWVIFANENRGGTMYIYSNYGFIEGAVRYNADMSWGRLHIAFFKFERQLLSGYMNGGLVDFVTARKTKQQECSIILCGTFDPTQYVTTELGEVYFGGDKGFVEKAVIKPYGEINLTLNYGPVDAENPGTGDIKVIEITEERVPGFEESVFYATLTIPADGDMDIELDIKCYDAIGNTCTTGYQTLTILTGQLVASVNIVWCTPVVDPAVCINVNDYIDDDAIALGWATIIGTIESEC